MQRNPFHRAIVNIVYLITPVFVSIEWQCSADWFPDLIIIISTSRRIKKEELSCLEFNLSLAGHNFVIHFVQMVKAQGKDGQVNFITGQFLFICRIWISETILLLSADISSRIALEVESFPAGVNGRKQFEIQIASSPELKNVSCIDVPCEKFTSDDVQTICKCEFAFATKKRRWTLLLQEFSTRVRPSIFILLL